MKTALLIFISIGGCSSSTTPVVATDAGSDASKESCPAAPPASSSCGREGLQCEYGDDPRPACRSIATCTSGLWVTSIPACPAPPNESCPMSRELASDATCAVEGAYCVYDELPCACTRSGSLHWLCDVPNPVASCAAARPRLGAPCAIEGQQCNYGCEAGRSRKCAGSVWTAATSMIGCD